jgi:hypothetical protein
MENTNETTNGFCDICGEQEINVKENLILSGWFIGNREHFCPNCND